VKANVRYGPRRVNTNPFSSLNAIHEQVCKPPPQALICINMYQIYATQSPGKPRWTMAATALLLLLTTGLAAALIQYKTRLYDVPLDKSLFLPDLGLKAGLPANWIPVTDTKISGIEVHIIEPENKAGQSRQLIIFSLRLTSMENPSIQAATYFDAIVQSLNPEVLYKTVLLPPTPIGPFPGWGVYAEPKIKSLRYQGPINYALGRVAVIQSGRIIGLILLVPKPPREVDQKLLDKISYHIEAVETNTDNSIANKADIHHENKG